MFARCRFTWMTSLIVVIPNWATALTSTPLSFEGCVTSTSS